MANFMGPMAPPQAAPNAPPQLDIRTNPSQRAQFKEFMQGMNRPVMPPTTAPIAPMLPAPMPSPMDQVDIFAPVPMANGGVADPFAIEGKIGQSVGPRMVGGTTNVFEGSGGNSGVTEDSDAFVDKVGGPLMEKLAFGQDLYNVNASYNDPSRPLFGFSQLFAPGAPFESAIAQPPTPAPSALQNAMNFAGGIMQGMQVPGPMGGTFSVRPVVQQGGLNDSLGIMANFSLPFEDGGPVGMFLGGDPQAYGEERGRQDTSETARERQRVGGTTNVFEGDSAPGGGDDDGDSVNEAIAAAQQAEDKGQFFEDVAASQKPVDLTFGAPRTDTSGMFTGGDIADDTAQATVTDFRDVGEAQRLADELMGLRAGDFNFGIGEGIDPVLSPLGVVESLIGLQPNPRDGARPDMVMNPAGVNVSPPPPAGMPGASPMTDLLAGEPGTSGAGDDSLTGRLGQLMAGDVVYNRGKDNERTVSRFADLENRMGIKDARVNKGQGLSALAEPILSKVASAFGGAKATDIFDNVVNQNKQAIIAADTNQIVGYADDGPFGRVYTGRAGYNPFGPDGASYTVDPQTGALIVNRQQPNQGEDDQQRNRASGQTPATPPPTTDPTDTTPPPLMITPPTTGLPPSGPSPTDVLVPSTRTNVPVTVPSILPTQGTAPTFLPQSFLDLLASFNRPAPRAMQDGGAVLDKAADDFLEALKVA